MDLEIENNKLELTRDDLIGICHNSIVPWQKWNNRDSYVSQLNVNECYGLLSADAEYTYTINNDTISINFINLTPEIIEKSHSYNLDYDSYELYKEEYPDDEMFEYYATVDSDDKTNSCYLPTKERLQEVDGEDWY